MITILSSIIAFFLGRYIAIIKRDKLPKEDIFTDSYNEIKQAIKGDRIRVISPSKQKENSLKDFENTDL